MATDLLSPTLPGPMDTIGEINKYDFRTVSKPVFRARKGLDADIVRQISDMKNEPEWMRDFRLRSLKIFESKPMPKWGGDIGINFQEIYYYLKPTDKQGHSWDEVPQEIKDTFDKLGIPEAEKKFLSGVKAQFESEVTGQPTILNAYALTAFITAGFVAGLAYWLIAGRKAGSGRVAFTVPRKSARTKSADVLAAGDADGETLKSPADTAPADKAAADKKPVVLPKRSGSLVERAENAADEVNGSSAAKSKAAAVDAELRSAKAKGSVPATSKKD